MSESQTTKIKSYDFFNQLCSLPFVEEVWLYGSRARGDYRDRSDIDLAIICPNARPSDWHQILDIVEDSDTLLKIDVVQFPDNLDESLKLNIQKDKVVLFKR